jgi:hypothetical protein
VALHTSSSTRPDNSLERGANADSVACPGNALVTNGAARAFSRQIRHLDRGVDGDARGATRPDGDVVSHPRQPGRQHTCDAARTKNGEPSWLWWSP